MEKKQGYTLLKKYDNDRWIYKNVKPENVHFFAPTGWEPHVEVDPPVEVKAYVPSEQKAEKQVVVSGRPKKNVEA